MKSVEEQRRANETYLLADGLGSAAFRDTFGSVFILKSITCLKVNNLVLRARVLYFLSLMALRIFSGVMGKLLIRTPMAS
jgi:hypothetical protein